MRSPESYLRRKESAGVVSALRESWMTVHGTRHGGPDLELERPMPNTKFSPGSVGSAETEKLEQRGGLNPTWEASLHVGVRC